MAIDLDAIQAFLEGVWPIYEAAEDWQEEHEHVCDVRCTAVNHIPDLTSHLAEASKELRAAREEHDIQGSIIQDLKVNESRAKALCVKQEIELRAAREVVAEAQKQGHGPDTDNPNCVQCKAVTAYLQVAGEVSGS